MSYDATILAETSLVSYWKLDETTGTAAADAKGSNAGTYSGGYTLGQGVAAGMTGSSVLLNGSTGCVTVPTSASLQLTGSFSVECWVKFTTAPAAGSFLWLAGCVTPANGSPFTDYGIGCGDSGGRFAVYCDAGGAFRSLTSTIIPGTGVWYHVVGVYDGAALKLYVNSTLEATSGSVTGAMVSHSTPFGIGANGRTPNAGFIAGYVDGVAVYNAALSASAVLAHYTAGTTAAPAGRFRRVGLDGGTNTLTGGTC